MYALSGQEILRIWEIGLGQSPAERALTILGTAFPELSREELLALSVGQRDAHLLTVREYTFGSQFASFAECQGCQEALEFTLALADLRITPEKEFTDQLHQVTAEGYELHFRLPNSLDLVTISSCREVSAARDMLVRRCVVMVNQNGVEVTVDVLPQTAITALASQMVERDPQAELQLDLCCPACGHRWSVVFDIVSFIWIEICVQARRLMREVHTLARAYGWREADILSMGTARRQSYLEMVT
jgi:hypothetical protein